MKHLGALHPEDEEFSDADVHRVPADVHRPVPVRVRHLHLRLGRMHEEPQTRQKGKKGGQQC